MNWTKLKNAISKTIKQIKNNPSKTYKDVKHFVQKHKIFSEAYQVAKLGLEGSFPEAIPIIEAVEQGAKFLDKFIEQNADKIDAGAQMVNRFI